MNTAYTTTGLQELAIGSVEVFQLDPVLNGVAWSLTGGSVSLVFSDPAGAQTTIPATVAGGGATATWTVVAPAGNWTRAWVITDAQGRHQVSLPVGFAVVSSPS